jgi:DNA-binding NtrC family response regulator
VEERKLRPVGSNKWEPMRARLILATRRNLEDASDEQFRRDLFERLRGFTLRIPPLRERRADLPLLVRCFVEEYNRDYPGDRKVPAQVLDSLFRYHWPGNVRELRLAVREAAAYAAEPNGPISAVHLVESAQRRTTYSENGYNVRFDPATDTWRQVLDRLRAKYFRSVLSQTGGNKDAAAHRAGLSRSQFYEILKGIDGEA